MSGFRAAMTCFILAVRTQVRGPAPIPGVKPDCGAGPSAIAGYDSNSGLRCAGGSRTCLMLR